MYKESSEYIKKIRDTLLTLSKTNKIHSNDTEYLLSQLDCLELSLCNQCRGIEKVKKYSTGQTESIKYSAHSTMTTYQITCQTTIPTTSANATTNIIPTKNSTGNYILCNRNYTT